MKPLSLLLAGWCAGSVAAADVAFVKVPGFPGDPGLPSYRTNQQAVLAFGFGLDSDAESKNGVTRAVTYGGTLSLSRRPGPATASWTKALGAATRLPRVELLVAELAPDGATRPRITYVFEDVQVERLNTAFGTATPRSGPAETGHPGAGGEAREELVLKYKSLKCLDAEGSLLHAQPVIQREPGRKSY
jgi:hypothetical protein